MSESKPLLKSSCAWAAHEQIQTIREQVKQRTGVHPDPGLLIRQLREGRD
jgi:hypothetical protein